MNFSKIFELCYIPISTLKQFVTYLFRKFKMLKQILPLLLLSKQTTSKSHAIALELRSIKDLLFFAYVFPINTLAKYQSNNRSCI